MRRKAVSLIPLIEYSNSLRPSLAARPSGVTNCRLFTQNYARPLFSKGQTFARPQLPFLSPAANWNTRGKGRAQWQLSRLVSTETQTSLRKGVYYGGKYVIIFWTFLFLLSVMAFGLSNEYVERVFPSPPDWSMISRWKYRCARYGEEEDEESDGTVDWSVVGSYYSSLLERLESSGLDGRGLGEQVEGGLYVPGVGSAGFDLSKKSYAWRRGYFLALMGAARCAQQLDGWVSDTSRQINFPGDVVIGPSNPKPKPVPIGSESPPLEENCTPAYEPPEKYYLRILTTHDFSVRERLEAAVTYADWLDFKGLPDSAQEMCNWALDIAISPFDVHDKSSVLGKSGELRSSISPTFLTPNVLLAVTAIGVHHARNGDYSKALPVLVSVLRARQALPPPEEAAPGSSSVYGGGHNPSYTEVFASFITSLISPPPYPSAPPSGNDPAHRTPASICLEAGLMSHIGEILFASSRTKEGLSWTRDAVDVAETQLREATVASPSGLRVSLSPFSRSALTQPLEDPEDLEGDGPAPERCTECLVTSTGNWQAMVEKLVTEEALVIAEKEGPSTPTQTPRRSWWRGWFWPTGNEQNLVSQPSGPIVRKSSDSEMGRWHAELDVVSRRADRIEELVETESRRRKRERLGPLWGYIMG